MGTVVYQDLVGTRDYYNVTVKVRGIQIISNVLQSRDTYYLITMLRSMSLSLLYLPFSGGLIEWV